MQHIELSAPNPGLLATMVLDTNRPTSAPKKAIELSPMMVAVLTFDEDDCD